MTRLGAAYGVSQQAVAKIIKGLTWKHLLPSFELLDRP